MSDLVPNWLDYHARFRPNHAALIYEDKTISYAALAHAAAETTGRLYCLGVRPGSRVAVLTRNRPEFVEILHGLTPLAAAIVPLNARLSSAEIVRQLEDCRPCLLIYEHATRDTVADIRGALPLTAVSVDADAIGGTLALAEVEPNCDTTGMAIDLNAVHSVIYTSGSTGHPKGALLTFGNHWWNAVGSAFNLGVQSDDRWLACLPFCHVGGLSILLRSLFYGTTAVIHNGFDPERVNRAIDTERVTILSVVTNTLQRLVDVRGERSYPPWLRCVLVGGGPVPLALLETCARRRVPVIQTYGLTEAASQVTTLPSRDALRKLGAAGKPLCTVEVYLSGARGPVAMGEVGEILIRGLTVSPGYISREPTRRDRDEWFRTGDLGRLDTEGFLYVLGRRDDMIISGGENIYPVEIETVLQAHPAVAEACAFGMPDGRWGETVMTCVQLRPGASLGARELEEYASGYLARFKVPRRIWFVDEFPRTASGKIVRHAVRALALRF